MKRFNFITLCFLLIVPLMLNGCPAPSPDDSSEDSTTPSVLLENSGGCTQDNDCPPGKLCYTGGTGGTCDLPDCNVNNDNFDCDTDEGCIRSQQRPNLASCEIL